MFKQLLIVAAAVMLGALSASVDGSAQGGSPRSLAVKPASTRCPFRATST